MKQTQNNEMDLLLRSMAKRASSVSDPGNGGQQTAHLDVDELNAFAENSLPSAARSRYTAHLIDCSHCRKLVTELSAAAGLPRVANTTDQVHSSFWQRLPAFLSPAVLRFAVPALAILGVLTVALLTFRQQQRPGNLVARQQEAQTAANSPVASDKGEPSVGTTNPAEVDRSPEVQARNASSTKESKTDAPKEQSKAVTLDGLTKSDSTPGVVGKDAVKSGEVAEQEAQPKFAPEPSAPAPAAAKTQVAATTEANKNEELAKQKEQVAEGARETRDERVAQDRAAGGLSRSRKAATAGRGGSGVFTSQGNEALQAQRSDQSGETREVAGRRFRKQGTSWVDSAYGGGRLVMTVVRGSEQYRVLIADEPGIRTIAEALPGEVIVVWKGRAYRIR